MLRRFAHWVKTGESAPPPKSSRFQPIQPVEDDVEQDDGFSIQVKEDLIQECWRWRLCRNGKQLSTYGDYGSEWTKAEAIGAAKRRIKDIKLIEQNEEQEWETVDG